MFTPRGNTRTRPWVAGLLLAAYGSAGMLGYGLHAFWECEHHCHEHSHAEGVAHSHPHVHGQDCHHHHHDHGVEVADRGDDRALLNLSTDECPICGFLVQAQTPFVLQVQVACAGTSHSFADLLHDTYNAPRVAVHPARGPPLG